MALNLEALGKPLGPVTNDYDWKDAVLYALGVGAGFDEIEYTYEKNLKVLPSFSIAAVFNFFPLFSAEANVNLAGILHGEQELIFHQPIPPEGTLTTSGCLTDFYDKGKDKGALVVGQSDTWHSNGKKLFTSRLTLFSRLDGGFGGENAPPQTLVMPERDPDFEVEDAPTRDQPLLYRLSGDIFQLHVDQEFAELAGFEKPIMHGLCTHGFACRALIKRLVPGRPERVRRMNCRFSKPLYPGDPIKTQIWKESDGRALWRVVNARSGETVIDLGVFEYGAIPEHQIRFDGRVAIVTGAGGGLGRAYALELARRGAKVVVNDLGGARDGAGEGSATPAEAVVAEIAAAGGEAVASFDNVARPEGGAAIVQTALAAFGTVDIVINNAGILRDKSFAKMTPENWQAVLDVHLSGAYHVTRPAFEVMKAKGYGRIVMTTSAAGLYGNFGQTNYSAAKLGLVGLMNTLKLEGAKYGIQVNTIAPLAASRLTADVMPPDLFGKMKPEFVVPLTLFLCAEECPESGNIYNAGMGFFNRAAVVTGPGTVVRGAGEHPSVEEVGAAMDRIAVLEGGKTYDQLNAQLADVLNAFEASPDGMAIGPDAGGEGGMSVAQVFEAMPAAFQPDAADGVSAVFQYRISGEGGGDWHCIVAERQCQVLAGAHERPTCTLLMAVPDFLAMMAGRLPPMQAFNTGQLKIEGDVMKSQLIEKLFKR
ncbi:MAG: SDR family NAD(P)-dependent oxidoreductase [Desulfobacterales bacterium]|nr:SDR family NAD(P)-dependent oxidoreductase [Desulfobacterales bacterium]